MVSAGVLKKATVGDANKGTREVAGIGIRVALEYIYKIPHLHAKRCEGYVRASTHAPDIAVCFAAYGGAAEQPRRILLSTYYVELTKLKFINLSNASHSKKRLVHLPSLNQAFEQRRMAWNRHEVERLGLGAHCCPRLRGWGAEVLVAQKGG